MHWYMQTISAMPCRHLERRLVARRVRGCWDGRRRWGRFDVLAAGARCTRPASHLYKAGSLITARGLGGFSGLISLLGREFIRCHWTVGRSRSCRRSSLMMHPMCLLQCSRLLQCSCLKWQQSSSCDGREIWTVTARTKCKCTRACCQCHWCHQ
jgi:hypothetical protein